MLTDRQKTEILRRYLNGEGVQALADYYVAGMDEIEETMVEGNDEIAWRYLRGEKPATLAAEFETTIDAIQRAIRDSGLLAIDVSRGSSLLTDELMSRIKYAKGQEQYYRVLTVWDRYAPRIKRFIIAEFGNGAESFGDDVIQEVFLSMLRASFKRQAGGSAGAFLFRMAINYVLSLKRKGGRATYSPVDLDKVVARMGMEADKASHKHLLDRAVKIVGENEKKKWQPGSTRRRNWIVFNLKMGTWWDMDTFEPIRPTCDRRSAEKVNEELPNHGCTKVSNDTVYKTFERYLKKIKTVIKRLEGHDEY